MPNLVNLAATCCSPARWPALRRRVTGAAARRHATTRRRRSDSAVRPSRAAPP